MARASVGVWLLGSTLTLACVPAERAEVRAPTIPAASHAEQSVKHTEAPELATLKTLSSIADLEPHLGDPRPEARLIVAERLAATRDSRAMRLLGKLVLDRKSSVAARAIAELGAVETPAAREILVGALAQRGDRDQDDLVGRLRKLGGRALLAFLAYVPQNAGQAWERQLRVLREVEELADPRAADALLAYLETSPHPHLRFRATSALASIADARAVPHLVWRLRQDPLELYSEDNDPDARLREYHTWEDHESNNAARLIGDLSQMHPQQKDKLREQAEVALLLWLEKRPLQPAEGMQALAELSSEPGRHLIRKWANPGAYFNAHGQPGLRDLRIAGEALRFLGRLRDEPSYPVLLKALREGRVQPKLSIGAAQGFSEWGHPRAVDPLLTVIRDTSQSRAVRLEACRALVWVAGDEAGALVFEEFKRHQRKKEQHNLTRWCLLTGLAERPVGVDALALLALLTEDAPPDERRIAAVALGRKGFGADIEQSLLDRVEKSSLAVDATIALMLGGKTGAVKRALLTLSRRDRRQVHSQWPRGFRFLSPEDVSNGLLFRLIGVAAALMKLEIDGEVQQWARVDVLMGLQNLRHGPHSIRPAVLRKHLFETAKTRRAWESPAALGRSATRALDCFPQDGLLMALLDIEHVDHEFVRQLLAEPWDPRTTPRR